MDIIKICGIAIIGAIAALTIKKYKPEMAVMLSIATGVFILLYVISSIRELINMIYEIIEIGGVESKYFYSIIKIVAVSYICEISCELCRDAGENAIATKLELSGKILIMLMSIPLIKSFLEVCINAVGLL